MSSGAVHSNMLSFDKLALDKKAIKQKVFAFIEQWWMMMGIGLAVMFAYFFPNVACSGGHIRSEYSISYGAVAIIFFLSGCSLPTKILLRMAGRWRAHLVCQTICFLITSAIIFGLAKAILASGTEKIDKYILVGMIVAGVTPTTVSSNIVMTKMAGGNDSLSLIEVTIGNLLGAFISPALLQLYLSDKTGFGYGNPANHQSVKSLYARVMKQLGCSLFIPLFVGQVVQYLFPKQVKHIYTKYKLSKVGSLCLVFLIWATFSNAFKWHSFTEISHESVIMVVFFNMGIYLFFTGICFTIARLPYDTILSKPVKGESSKIHSFAYWFIAPFKFSRKDTVAIMLVGAAKTVALGIPLIQAQYGDSEISAVVSVPLVLYQGEQIFVAQALIPLFKRWIAREEAENDQESPDQGFSNAVSHNKSSN